MQKEGSLWEVCGKTLEQMNVRHVSKVREGLFQEASI